MTERDYWEIIAALKRIEYKLDRLGKEEHMADETLSQVDADFQALNQQVQAFLSQLTAFLNGLAIPNLTDAQQADLNALKASVTQLSTALPAAQVPVAAAATTTTTTSP